MSQHTTNSPSKDAGDGKFESGIELQDIMVLAMSTLAIAASLPANGRVATTKERTAPALVAKSAESRARPHQTADTRRPSLRQALPAIR